MRNVLQDAPEAPERELRRYFSSETYKRRLRRQQRERASVEAVEAAREIAAYFAEGTYGHAANLAMPA